MRTDVSNARQEEGFWKVNSYEEIGKIRLGFLMFLSQTERFPEMKHHVRSCHWVVSKIANHLHLGPVIFLTDLDRIVGGGLAEVLSIPPSQNSLGVHKNRFSTR